MRDIEYRQAGQHDIPSLAEIRSVNSATKEHWAHRIDRYYHGLVNPQDAMPPRILYLAAHNNKVVGFIAGHLTRRLDCEGELQWIDTINEYRGQGIASQLIRVLAKWFIDKKAYRICVDPGDQKVRDFYYKNGATDLNAHWLYWNDIRDIF